ncbi:MAG TPA: hypothetical protein VGM98_19680 [Schlesneria sp.]|jgi:phosphomannomutase
MSIVGADSQQTGLDHSRGANSTIKPDAPSSLMYSLSDLIRSNDGQAYTCPGESYQISRSVHLARLASGFAECRTCPQNDAVRRSSMTTPVTEPSPAGTLVTSNGIRGTYLNEIDRSRATNWGAAFASLLWDKQPRIGRATDANESTSLIARPGPMVVIGFDERPSSPDIVMGIALGLRRMGCQVVDLGQTTGPCFRFASHHLDAAGGVFVTGAGCDPAWTGFQFTGSGSIPWMQPEILRTMESRAKTIVVRPTRHAGTQRAFNAAVPYEAGLWKLFHALRPLRVACGSATRQLPKLLDQLFARLPCQITHEILPVRRRDLGDSHDADVQRVAAATVHGQHHLGIVVDDDGERCAFVTDQGQLVSIAELLRLLTLFELHDHRSARVVLDNQLDPQIRTSLQSINPACQVETTSVAELPSSLIHYNADLGLTADHRVWFGGAYPACNAIQTLARVLQALSLSDAPMSELLQRAA